MDRQTARQGALLVAVATVGLALKGIWARLAYAEGLDVAGVVFYRAVMAAPLTVALGYWMRGRAARSNAGALRVPTLGDWLKAIGLGLFFPLGMWSDFQAIAYLGAGVSRVILFGFPVLVLLFDALLQRRWPRRHRLLGFAVAWLGLAGVAIGGDGRRLPGGGKAELGTGLCWAVGSLWAYAVFVWCSGRLTERLGAVRITVTSQLAAAVVVVGGVWTLEQGQLPTINSQALVWVAAMVGVSTIGPYFLLNEGIARLGAARAGLLAMFGPTVTLFAGVLLLGESLTPTQVLATLATLWGVTLARAGRWPQPFRSVFDSWRRPVKDSSPYGN